MSRRAIAFVSCVATAAVAIVATHSGTPALADATSAVTPLGRLVFSASCDVITTGPSGSTDELRPLGIGALGEDASNPQVLVRTSHAHEFDGLPTWSPDGRWVTYEESSDDEPVNIRAVPAGGGTPVNLAAGTAPTWAPDGQHLAFLTGLTTSQASVVIERMNETASSISLDSSDRIVIPVNGQWSGGLSWSPDGQLLTYWVPWDNDIRDGFKTMVTTADGRSQTPYAPAVHAHWASPEWSPDGLWLSIVGSTDPRTETNGESVWIAHRDGSGLRNLVPNGGGFVQAHWHPTGAFLGIVSTTFAIQMWTPLGEHLGDITTPTGISPTEFHWQPDGLRAVYLRLPDEHRSNGGEADVYSKPLVGNDEWRLTDDQSAYSLDAFSPGILRRLFGLDRIGTAAAISNAAYPTADTVIVASSGDYGAALAGAPLAAQRHAPILLAATNELDPRDRTEIQRLHATHAVLLGGTDQLSDQVALDLRAAGVTDVQRISGSDRFELAAATARTLGHQTAAYVVEGENPDPNRGWPDAVSVSGLAALQTRPILYVTRDTIPAATEAALDDLGVSDITLIGGTSAISDAVAGELANNGRHVNRISGSDRYATSAAVASAALQAGAHPNTIYLATGTNWPDSVAAGPAAAAQNAPLLLVNGVTGINGSASEQWLNNVRGSVGTEAITGGLAAITAPVAVDIGNAATLLPTTAPTPAQFCSQRDRVNNGGSTTTSTTPSSSTTTTSPTSTTTSTSTTSTTLLPHI